MTSGELFLFKCLNLRKLQYIFGGKHGAIGSMLGDIINLPWITAYHGADPWRFCIYVGALFSTKREKRKTINPRHPKYMYISFVLDIFLDWKEYQNSEVVLG